MTTVYKLIYPQGSRLFSHVRKDGFDPEYLVGVPKVSPEAPLFAYGTLEQAKLAIKLDFAWPEIWQAEAPHAFPMDREIHLSVFPFLMWEDILAWWRDRRDVHTCQCSRFTVACPELTLIERYNTRRRRSR